MRVTITTADQPRVVAYASHTRVSIAPVTVGVTLARVGPQGPAGAGADAALLAHINAAEPHPAYDHNMDLNTYFENGLSL